MAMYLGTTRLISLGRWLSTVPVNLSVSKDVTSELTGQDTIYGGDPLWKWYGGAYFNKGNANSAVVTVDTWAPTTGWSFYYAETLTGAGAWETTITPPSTGGLTRIKVTWTFPDSTTWEEVRIVDTIDTAAATDDRIIALHAMERPEVTHVVWQTMNGEIMTDKNPE